MPNRPKPGQSGGGKGLDLGALLMFLAGGFGNEVIPNDATSVQGPMPDGSTVGENAAPFKPKNFLSRMAANEANADYFQNKLATDVKSRAELDRIRAETDASKDKDVSRMITGMGGIPTPEIIASLIANNPEVVANLVAKLGAGTSQANQQKLIADISSEGLKVTRPDILQQTRQESRLRGERLGGELLNAPSEIAAKGSKFNRETAENKAAANAASRSDTVAERTFGNDLQAALEGSKFKLGEAQTANEFYPQIKSNQQFDLNRYQALQEERRLLNRFQPQGQGQQIIDPITGKVVAPMPPSELEKLQRNSGPSTGVPLETTLQPNAMDAGNANLETIQIGGKTFKIIRY